VLHPLTFTWPQARINCAHGSRADHEAKVAAIRAAEAAMRVDGAGKPYAGENGRRPLCGSRHDVVAIAFDIKGPKIRVGLFGDTVPRRLPSGELVYTDGAKIFVGEQPIVEGQKERLKPASFVNNM